MADVTGARGTGNVSQSQRKIDMAQKVLELEPNAAPLTVLSKMLGKRAAVNPEYSWQQDDLEPRFDAINNGAGYSNSATSLVVDNGAYFAQHYLVKVTRTGEVIRVTAVSSNTLTVVRGVGGGAAALNDNDELLIIGVAQPEGDTSRPARSSNPTKVTNYTEIFRTPVEATGTLLSSDQFTTPHDWPRQLNKAGIEHQKDIEYAIWLGAPSEDLTGSQPRRTTGGVLHYADQNHTDAGGAFTEAEFFAALRPVYRYSSDRRVAFGSMLAVDVLNSYPRGNIQVQQAGNPDTYGLQVFKYVSPHGTLRLITHRLFEGTVYSGYLVVLDMDQITYRFLGGGVEGSRDTHIRQDIQPPDEDGRKSEYLTEGGLEFGQSKAHGVISNITG
jgi:hypothetical protein